MYVRMYVCMYVCMYSCGAARAQRSAVAAVYPFYHVIQRYIQEASNSTSALASQLS